MKGLCIWKSHEKEKINVYENYSENYVTPSHDFINQKEESCFSRTVKFLVFVIYEYKFM